LIASNGDADAINPDASTTKPFSVQHLLCYTWAVIEIIPAPLRRREFAIAALLTALLWVVALVLWSFQDLVSGEPFSVPYKLLLAKTYLLGLFFSAVLAAVIGLSRPLARYFAVPLIAGAAIALAGLHGLIDAYLLLELYQALDLRTMPVSEFFNRGLMPFVLIYGLYATAVGLMLSQMAVSDTQRHLAEARNIAQAAQLAALRFQLNPHFLFNTLNAISSLIVLRRNREAEQMTMKLSEFLRASLEADPNAEVTLDEELTTTQSYLDIEAGRFAERLQLEFDCPRELLGASVPSFLLQPLVENSVKYAVAPSRDPVSVSVRASAAEGLLCLVVENGRGRQTGRPPIGGTGLGLANVRRRLAAFYGSSGQVVVRETKEAFAVMLTLPLRYSEHPGPTA
jgi:hypothetical protein